MILKEVLPNCNLSAYEHITGKKIERNFDDVIAEGVDSSENGEKFRVREAVLKVQRLGRPLTEEEMKEFEIK